MSDLEDTLAFFLRAAKIPAPEREFQFHPERKWRFDFAWPDLWLAVEVEGGTRNPKFKSRHLTPNGFAEDCIKYAEAAILGWTVLRFDSDQTTNGYALSAIERAMQCD